MRARCQLDPGSRDTLAACAVWDDVDGRDLCPSAVMPDLIHCCPVCRCSGKTGIQYFVAEGVRYGLVRRGRLLAWRAGNSDNMIGGINLANWNDNKRNFNGWNIAMSGLQIDELKKIPGVKLEEPNPNLTENDGILSNGFTLPKAHADLLSISNGMSICDGYYKLFGLNNEKNKNLEIWNEREYWKFAWEGRVDNFLCFATTAWGDQYAYRKSSVEQGEASPIFFLHAFSMEADLIANSFEEFWQKNFIRKAKDPIDEMVTRCRAIIGPLGWDEFLVYNPPLELGGTEDVSALSKMQPRPAMIINADLAVGMDKLSDDAVIEGMDTYIDKLGRMRIRYIISDGSPKNFPFKF